jgi:hypothetical protein
VLLLTVSTVAAVLGVATGPVGASPLLCVRVVSYSC